jgi:alpha-beta hydrolase superfamily lysophospholipase
MRYTLRFLARVGRYLAWGALGFILGAFGFYVYLLRSGPPLQPWHTEQLTAEFTAAKAEEIRSLEDYIRLEDELFEQLDGLVYARVDTGPAHQLARYSRDSSADPGRWRTNWNRSFQFPARRAAGGALLLHGMSDGPYSLRALGEALAARGYWVLALRLPGHGTLPSGLETITWEDMAAAVDLGMSHLATKVRGAPIHIIGYSTGAPLALDFTLRALEGTSTPMPASLSLISPAIGVHPAAGLAGWKNTLAALPGLQKLAWTQILPEFDPFKYNSFTSNAAEQVHRLTRSVARRIEARAASGPIEAFPRTLVALSIIDATVSTDAVVDNLFAHLAARRHELLLFDINHASVNSAIMVSNPRPLIDRLMAENALPFGLTLVTNENAESNRVVSYRKKALSAAVSTTRLNLHWPQEVISLSHVALPFPPDDPLYGRNPPGNGDIIFLGQLAIQGERGLLKLSGDWLLRLRHNPFFDYMESRILEWLDGVHGDGEPAASADDVTKLQM